MGKTTEVLLITGFLGSGKTTFLNRVIDRFPKDRKLTILMNEFGEIGVDGQLIHGDDIDMMEISRGSIFCVCVKTDFIKGLYELNATIQPDLLIIESTGVANPTDLKRDLQLPIFNNRFKFVDQFCLIDAVNFLEAFEIFASVEKQLSTSTVFIINKTDLAEAETLQKIKDVIQEHHASPHIFETTFSDIPLHSFPFLSINDDGRQPEGVDAVSALLSAEQLDSFISEMLEESDLGSTPPDELSSVTYRWHGKDLEDIKEMAENLTPDIVRAKGFVREGGHVYLFSYVMGGWTIELSDHLAEEIKTINMIVFIGKPGAIASLDEKLVGPHWSAREILQPFGQIGTL